MDTAKTIAGTPKAAPRKRFVREMKTQWDLLEATMAHVGSACPCRLFLFW